MKAKKQIANFFIKISKYSFSLHYKKIVMITKTTNKLIKFNFTLLLLIFLLFFFKFNKPTCNFVHLAKVSRRQK